MGITGNKEKEGERRKLINSGFEKTLVSIENKSIKGLGILCKLTSSETNSFLPVLITTTELIGNNELTNTKLIKFTLDNTLYEIKINEDRKTYINEDKYNIVIIEIKPDDNLNTNSFMDIEKKEKMKTDDLIGVVINNLKEKNMEYLICKINNIKEDGNNMEYVYKDKDKNQFMGNPIINMDNNKIIAIQKNSGSGVLLFNAINEFMESTKKKEQLTKSIYQSYKSTATLKSTIRIDNAKLNKEIAIVYLLPEKEGITVLKIFGEQFVKNNKNKCTLILHDDEKDEEYEYNLCAYLDLDFINSINSGRKLFKIFLVQTDYFYDLSFMFCECFTLMSVDGLTDLYYDQVTNMKSMFHSCFLLQEIKIANINTSEVKDMSFMFESCKTLSYINLSGWDTKNVKTMKAMFESCGNLVEIEGIENWDLSSLKDISFMFNFCKKFNWHFLFIKQIK